MAGFLRFAVYLVLLAGLFVLVVLPLLLSPLLTQMVRDMGVRSETLNVSVALFDPSLLVGRSKRVTITATDVEVTPGAIGSVDLALIGADYFDRSFESVEGELRDITLAVAGEGVGIARIDLGGRAEAAGATARLSADQTESLVRLAARRAGIALDQVRVSDAGVTVSLSGLETTARVLVRGGALLLDPGFGTTVVLLQPAPSDPWRLEEAWTSSDGLNIRATVDAVRLTSMIQTAST